MAHTRLKSKGRRNGRSFLKLNHDMISHPNFRRLSPRAVKLLIDIASMYRGKNNGDLTTAWSVMRQYGWTSKDQLQKARTELLEHGWIVLTRQGRRPKVASLFAITWEPIDECNGKHDRQPTGKALDWWKLGYDPEKKTLSETRHTDQIYPVARVNGVAG